MHHNKKTTIKFLPLSPEKKIAQVAEYGVKTGLVTVTNQCRLFIVSHTKACYNRYNGTKGRD